MRKPRAFRRPYIYYDERKEKRAEIKENAEREMGVIPEREFKPEDIRGKFVAATTHLRRRKESGKKPMSPGLMIIIIVLLLLLMRFLMS